MNRSHNHTAPQRRTHRVHDLGPARTTARTETTRAGMSLGTACLVVLTLLALFYTAYFAKAVLVPIVLAVMLSVVLRPGVAAMSRWGVPNALSATLLFVCFAAAVGIGSATLAGPAEEWVRQAPQTFNTLQVKLRGLTRPLARLQEAKKEVEELAATPGEFKPTVVRVEQPSLATQMLSTTGGFMASAAITLTTLFFLLAAGDRFLEKAVEVVPTWRGKRDIVTMAKNIEHRISVYLGAITVINVGLGLAIGLGMWAIGMPNPALWGVLAALLNYIPYAGLIVGTAIVSAVAVTSFESLGHAALAPLVYLAANGAEANLMTPLILGRSIDLNPVVILLALFVIGWVWGIVGVFLAVPLLLVAKIVCESYEATQPIAVFLSQ